ncbi:hypothetical protein [uncultured Sphaerochaeta sp.]|uniref:hypothetical protein n=1 Tax=uncultured Sphaerochaeta sp. TaxID=886478 RepID=UPI002A0A21F0|nr:hypothetical protein [uncultured Sphaerochaeta sp.]
MKLCPTDRENEATTLNNRLSAMKTFYTYLMQYQDSSFLHLHANLMRPDLIPIW